MAHAQKDHDLPELADLFASDQFDNLRVNRHQGYKTPNRFGRGGETPVGERLTPDLHLGGASLHQRTRSAVKLSNIVSDRLQKSIGDLESSKSLIQAETELPNNKPTKVPTVNLAVSEIELSTSGQLLEQSRGEAGFPDATAASDAPIQRSKDHSIQNSNAGGPTMPEVCQVSPRMSFGGDADQLTSAAVVIAGCQQERSAKSKNEEADQAKNIQLEAPGTNPFAIQRLNLKGLEKGATTVKKTPRWYVPGNSGSEAGLSSAVTSERNSKLFPEDNLESPNDKPTHLERSSLKKAPSTVPFELGTSTTGPKAWSGQAPTDKHGGRSSFAQTGSRRTINQEEQGRPTERGSELKKADSQDCIGDISNKCSLI